MIAKTERNRQGTNRFLLPYFSLLFGIDGEAASSVSFERGFKQLYFDWFAEYHVKVELLGSRADRLPRTVESALFDWVWHKSDGIGYLEVPLANPPRKFTAGMLDRLFTSLEILWCFPSWHKQGKSIVDWFWKQRNNDGLWDFGPRAFMSVYFPLSESWRETKRRQHDWTTRTLVLLRKFYS